MGRLSSAFRVPLTLELKNIQILLSDLECEKLTDWETEFVGNLQDRINAFQGEALFSDSQREWLSRLAEKYDLDPA